MPFTDQQKAAYVEMRADGMSKEEALARIQGGNPQPSQAPSAFDQWKAQHRFASQSGVGAPEGEVLPNVGAGEAFGRGAAQAATLQFGDEAQGLIQSVGDRIMGYGQEPASGRQSVQEDYIRERDAARAQNERAHKAHPGAYIAGQVAGGVATAPVMGNAKTLGQVVGLGAKIGAASGLGGSDAELTRGDGTYGPALQAAWDTTKGAAIGAGGAAAGYGIAKAAGATGRWLLDKLGARSRVPDAARQSAQVLAENMDAPSAIGTSEATVGSKLEESRALQAEFNDAGKEVGAQIRFTPAQMSGSRAQGLRELRYRNNPATMDEAQRLETQQLENAGKIAGVYVRRVANNPDSVGSSGIAKNTADVVSRYGEKLLTQRAAVARPIYEAAEKAGGGVDYAPIKAAFEEEIRRYNLNPNQATGLLRSLYSKLEKTGAGGGLALGELNSIRSQLLGVIRGKESLAGMPSSVETGIAGRLLDKVDDAFTAAESTSSGAAAQLWRQANEAWRKGTAEYENAMTDTVQQILKLGSGDKASTIPKRLLESTPDQVSAVFQILGKEAPADAANLRAQMLEEILVMGGKPSTLSPTSAAAGTDKLQPGSILRMLSAKEYGPKLEAAFAGDTKALLALRRMHDLFQRVGFGPNIRGSSTQPQLADVFAELGGGVLDRMAAGNGYTALAIQVIRKNLEAITGNAKVAGQVWSTPEGIDATNRALGLILDGKTGKPITEATIRSVAAAMSNLGIGVTGMQVTAPAAQQQDEPQPPPMSGRPIAGEAYPQ